MRYNTHTHIWLDNEHEECEDFMEKVNLRWLACSIETFLSVRNGKQNKKERKEVTDGLINEINKMRKHGSKMNKKNKNILSD